MGTVLISHSPKTPHKVPSCAGSRPRCQGHGGKKIGAVPASARLRRCSITAESRTAACKAVGATPSGIHG